MSACPTILNVVRSSAATSSLDGGGLPVGEAFAAGNGNQRE